MIRNGVIGALTITLLVVAFTSMRHNQFQTEINSDLIPITRSQNDPESRSISQSNHNVDQSLLIFADKEVLEDRVSVGLNKEIELPANLNYTDNWCTPEQLTENAQLIVAQDLDAFFSERGYKTDGYIDAYIHYDEDTLRTLGAQGDLVALDALYRTVWSEEDAEKSREPLILAAIQGSTVALERIAHHYIYEAEKYRSTDRNRFKELILMAMAYSEVRVLRGDPNAIGFAGAFSTRAEIDIGEEEISKISELVSEIYSYLEERRSEAQLPPFDNSIPRVMKLRFEQNIAQLDLAGTDSWPGLFIEDLRSDCIDLFVEWYRPAYESVR